MKTVRWFSGLGWLLCVGLCVAGTPSSSKTPSAKPRRQTAQKVKKVHSLKFTGPEIFPIADGIMLLQAGDFNEDGLTDLVVVDNIHSKITFLINQTGKKANSESKPQLAVGEDINQLPPDARFRIESLASEKRITSLCVGDFNSDGYLDLAYYGVPKEIVVVLAKPKKGLLWQSPRRWPITDGSTEPYALDAGDLNGDGRTDLVLLSEKGIYLLYQNAQHQLEDPVRLPVSRAKGILRICDVNSDGRNDLLFFVGDQEDPFRFRFQQPNGSLGPEQFILYHSVRAFEVADLDGKPPMEWISIGLHSGRVELTQMDAKRGESLTDGLRWGEVSILPLEPTGKSSRGIAWADLDHDGDLDLVASDPEGSRLALYRQGKDGFPGLPQWFPSLAGISTIRIADWNQDGRPELFLLSTEERLIGISTFEKNGRITFPTPWPLEERPLAMDVGKLLPGEPPVLVAAVESKTRSRSLVWIDAQGHVGRTQLSSSFRGTPSQLLIHDVDQDGLKDVVLVTPYEKLRILRQTEPGKFEELELSVPGSSGRAPQFAVGDLNGDGKPELLLTERNFVRALTLQKMGQGKRWSLMPQEQINGASSQSRITGAAPIPAVDSKEQPAGVVLLDQGMNMLSFCTKDPKTGVWSVVRSLRLPKQLQFRSLYAVHLQAKNQPVALLVGLSSVAWLPLQGTRWNMSLLDDYEPPLRKPFLQDVVVGDFDGDGRKELVFLETNKHFVDIVRVDETLHFKPVLRWPVFEEPSRSSSGPISTRGSVGGEPREALIQDVTHDGKPDLLLVVHDRVLLYPQK